MNSSQATTDICVIGAGSAGLSVAAAAAGLGARVTLIERGAMGGECLNTGCVPSKALLAAAKQAHSARNAAIFGIAANPVVDFAQVHAHVHEAIDAIAPHDSVERFEQLGVEVIRAQARFLGPRLVLAGNRAIRAHRVVIATGSEPAVPKLAGLAGVRFLTNETIFDNARLPEHLIVLGGGPLGIELAQAHRRLGSRVTVVEHGKAMPKDDPELARPLLRLLAAEGIAIREGAKATAVEPTGAGIAVTVEEAGQTSRVEGSHLLVATGRRPRVDGLDLARAGVDHDDKGIVVDARLRTTAHGVYAAGDVAHGPNFTHVCAYHAAIVIRNAIFHWPSRVDYRSLPWVTYTDPELAQVGMTEARARMAHGDDVRVARVDYADNDRAQAERRPRGLLKLVARRNGLVLGASILGAHAGELALLWVLAIKRGLRLRDIAQLIAPYPTWSELDKAAAAEFLKPKLFNDLTRRVVRVLSWLP